MGASILSIPLRIALALCFVIVVCTSLAAESFGIAATNVTMPASGMGVSQFTVTAIPVTGTITLTCKFAGTPADADVPSCPLTPPVAYQVEAGGTLKGTIAFYPYGSAVPATMPLGSPHGGGRLPGRLALAGTVLLGLGLRPSFRKRLSRAVFAIIVLAAMAAIPACSGPAMSGVPAGNYPYTVAAFNAPNPNGASAQTASTTMYVTIP